MEDNDLALRLLADLAQDYATWRDDMRIVAPGRLAWRSRGNRDYLYRIRRSTTAGETSLGARSPETELQYAAYRQAKERLPTLDQRLAVHCAMYRQLRMPLLPAFAGAALRELDVDRQMGQDGVLVVGTNALIAYAIEATQTLASTLTATRDFDLTWVRRTPFVRLMDRPVFDAVKRADATWTVNQERTFQIRNRDGEEIELLLPQALADSFPRTSGLRPVPLPEQDWLMHGRYVEHVVACGDRTPARIVAPDPRWFALHKRWLADKPTRDPLKKPKDLRQAETVWRMLRDHMPHYPVDADFVSALPDELKPVLRLLDEKV